MALPMIGNLQAYRYEDGAVRPVDLKVSAEYHFTLCLNGAPYIRLACSGGDLEHLAMGHLLTEGIIASKRDVEAFSVDEAGMRIDVTTARDDRIMERLFSLRMVSSSCGQAPAEQALHRPGSTEFPGVSAVTIIKCMGEFLKMSDIHRATHGVHSAALYSAEGVKLVFFDEIGRHNAVDKVLGWMLATGKGPGGCMLLTTGRLASEIVFKAVAGGVGALVSRAAPTTKSVEISLRHNILLIGGVKGSGFYIFNGKERVLC